VKNLRFFIPMLLLLSVGLFAENISLDQAVQSSVERIESRLEQGSQVAVLVFDAPSQDLAKYIIDEIVEAISSNGKLKLIERKFTDAIRKEMDIQLSGDVSDDDAKQIGKQLGAQYVITGTLDDVGDAYRFRVAAIDVETAVRQASSSLDIDKTDPRIVHFTKDVQPPAVAQTTQSAPAPAPAVASTPQATQGRVYQIGERGPAGGIVFYDKVTFSDGWRYLEAAPTDTEIANARWGTYKHDVSGTQMALGSGKRNTHLINDFLRSINESGRAAQLCTQLNSGGFTDWFLPSMEELNWMFLNLHKKGLGGFKNERYWSSSQVNATHAWYRHFGDNGRASYDKDKDGDGWVFRYNIRVRAIRAF